MSDNSRPPRWQVVSETVRGTSHERAGTPNQDAIVCTTRDQDRVVIAAVADGHGSRKCFRSDRGSRFATAAANRALDELAAAYIAGDGGTPPPSTTAELHQFVQSDMLRRIVNYWRHDVDRDLVGEPISATELEPLSPSDQEAVSGNAFAAYGTTLVAALLTPSHAVYLQLGDGDILVVADVGCEAGRPLPPDPRSFANETASLGAADASTSRRPGGEPAGPWGDFRVRVVPVTADPPALVLLTTDGYPNAFVADAGFQKAATDLLAFGREHGWDFVKRELRGWLEEASRQGSGDDVTVALLVRELAPRPAASAGIATGSADPPTAEDVPAAPPTPLPEAL